MLQWVLLICKECGGKFKILAELNQPNIGNNNFHCPYCGEFKEPKEFFSFSWSVAVKK